MSNAKPIDTMLIISDPKRFEPRETHWEGGKLVGLEELLREFPGDARGDLIMVVVRHPLDVVTVDGKMLELSEWFHSLILRWTGFDGPTATWEVVGLGKSL